MNISYRRERPSLNGEDVAQALAYMPDPFRNEDFRNALGIASFPASEILSALLKNGRVIHPTRNRTLWKTVHDKDFIGQSDLTADGTASSPPEIHAFVDRIKALVEERVDMTKSQLHIWSYRYGSIPYLCIDIADDEKRNFGLTIHVDGPTNLDIPEPTVWDMTEALHLASLIARRLRLPIEIGQAE